MSSRMHRAVVGALVAVLAACSSAAAPAPETAPAAAAEFPVTVGDLTLEARPERIVSLSPTATEMLWAIGAGAQVVAVDEYSTYPQEAAEFTRRMAGDLIQHVVEKWQARFQAFLARPIEVNRHPNLCFGGVSADLGGSHDGSFGSMIHSRHECILEFCGEWLIAIHPR